MAIKEVSCPRCEVSFFVDVKLKEDHDSYHLLLNDKLDAEETKYGWIWLAGRPNLQILLHDILYELEKLDKITFSKQEILDFISENFGHTRIQAERILNVLHDEGILLFKNKDTIEMLV